MKWKILKIFSDAAIRESFLVGSFAEMISLSRKSFVLVNEKFEPRSRILGEVVHNVAFFSSQSTFKSHQMKSYLLAFSDEFLTH